MRIVVQRVNSASVEVDGKSVGAINRGYLVLLGIKEPETDEEKQMLLDAQSQQNQPSPEMLLAMAENKKGDAELLREKREGIKMQLEFQNKDTKNQIDAFNAETNRMDTQIDAQEAGAKINKTNIEAFGEQIDNRAKLDELMSPANMKDDELLAELMAG